MLGEEQVLIVISMLGTQQVSGDREAGPEPADCPPRPSAAAGVKKRLLSCWGRGMRPLRPAGHSPLCPVRWDRGSGQPPHVGTHVDARGSQCDTAVLEEELESW